MKIINRQCLILGVVTMSSFGLAGCGEANGDGVPVQELVSAAQQNLEGSLRGAHAAAAFLARSSTIASSLSSLAGEDCVVESGPCAIGAVCPEVETCTENSVTVNDLAEAHQDLGEGIDDLLEELRNEVFTEANRESSDENSVTYRFNSSIGCTTESALAASDAAASPSAPQGVPIDTPEPESEDSCASQAARIQPRLRLSSTGPDSVTIQYLVGSARHNPITIELSPKRAAAQLDLDELTNALHSIDDDVAFSELSGKLELELVENGALDYSARLNVLKTLSVRADDEYGEPITLTIAPSKPTIELRLDGNAREVRAKLDLGTLNERGALGAFRSFFEETQYDEFGEPLPGKPYTGNIDLTLAGVEGAVNFDGNADRLALTGLGLGDTTSVLKFNDATIAALDVNPNTGRHFDLTVHDNEGRSSLSFSPGLDVSLFLNFSPLATQISDLPSFTLGDTLRFLLDGANPSLEVNGEQLRVLSGTLSASSSRTPEANLVVPAGSCLGNSSTDTPGAHELLGELAVVACE